MKRKFYVPPFSSLPRRDVFLRERCYVFPLLILLLVVASADYLRAQAIITIGKKAQPKTLLPFGFTSNIPGGSTFNLTNTTGFYAVQDVGVGNNGTVWLTGRPATLPDNGGIFYRTEGSTNWTLLAPPAAAQRLDVDENGRAVVSTVQGSIFSWTGTTLVGLPTTNVVDVGLSAINNNPLYVLRALGGGCSGLAQYNGTSFVPITGPPCAIRLDVAPDGSVWEIGQGGVNLYHITISGSTGTVVDTIPKTDFADVTVAADGTVWASDRGGRLYRVVGDSLVLSSNSAGINSISAGSDGDTPYGTYEVSGPDLGRLIQRNEDDTYINHHTINTTNTNTVTYNVPPGTYTITENAPQEELWKLTGITTAGGTASTDVAGRTATITVGAGQTAYVQFDNALPTVPATGCNLIANGDFKQGEAFWNDPNNMWGFNAELGSMGTVFNGATGQAVSQTITGLNSRSPVPGVLAFNFAVYATDGIPLNAGSRGRLEFWIGGTKYGEVNNNVTGSGQAVIVTASNGAITNVNTFFKATWTPITLTIPWTGKPDTALLEVRLYTTPETPPGHDFVLAGFYMASVCPVEISGTVHNDPDGGSISGPGTNASGSLYATLLDSTDAPVATDTVAANGTYSFPNVLRGNYTIVLGTAPNDITADLPTGWINTNEGVTPAGDGTLNGTIPITVDTTDITTADFAIMPASITLSGTVHSDPDGGDISGTGTNAGGALYATLLNSSGSPVATDTIAANGTYLFPNVAPGDYTVVLGTTPGDSTAGLPTGYINTNEGLTPTGDGTTNGTIPVTVAAVNVTNVDFAIEQLPVATPATVPSQPNPGGTTTADITPYFTGTDPDGTVDSLYFPTFPDNVVTLVIDGTPYDSTNFPAGGVTVPEGSTVLIDPVDGAVTPVIPFSVVDNAGEQDPTPENVSVPFTVTPGVNLSGIVHSDPDGGDISGTGTNAGGALYATLLNSSGFPVATDTIAANGTYLFPNVAPGDYTVVLGTTPGDSTAGLPAGYVNTNEGLTPTGDGITNGTIPVTVAAANITNVDFAIEQLPVATPATVPSHPNPGGTTMADITPYFTGTDPDGTVDSLYFPTFPDNVVTLVIDGTPYDSTNFPAGGVTVPEGSTVLIDPVDGAVTPVIPFSVIDNAGEEDPTPADLTVPFTIIPGVTLSGTVYSDPDGGDISGTGTNAGNTLLVTLLDSTGAPVATDSVAAAGTYIFPNVTPGDYTVVLSTTPNDSMSVLPAGYVNTNEGLTPTGDGTPDGTIPVIVEAVDVVNVDFAIEQLPVATTATVARQPNPGGTTTVDITSYFTGTDPDGTVESLHFPTFPDNVAAFIIAGTPHDLASFPAGGITVPTGSSVLIDPVDGPVTPVILFHVIDNAGEQDPTPADVTVPFTLLPGLTLSGKVFNDASGGDIDGIGTNVSDSLYIVLLDSTGTPVAVDSVAVDGTYSFENVAPGNYTILLGAAPDDSTASLPTGWINTNEGVTPTGDGTLDGVILVTLTDVDVTTADFAIERPPLTPSEPITTLPQPEPDQIVALDGQSGNPPALSGNDPEDGKQGAGDRFIITALPVNGILLYDGAPVVEDDTIDAYDPSLLAVQLTGSGYTEIIFEYAFLDSAGVQGPAALYTLNWSAPLPVTLTSFTVKAAGDPGMGQTAVLNWTTTQETNSDRFEIERSVNGKTWAMIGTVHAKGESSVLVRYEFTDKNPEKGDNLYRLRMIDQDATFAYSRIRSIDFDIPVRTILYPNPVVDKLMLDVDDISTIARIQINDLTGKVVYDQVKRPKADLSKDIDVKHLSTGAYVVLITRASGRLVSFKIVKP